MADGLPGGELLMKERRQDAGATAQDATIVRTRGAAVLRPYMNHGD